MKKPLPVLAVAPGGKVFIIPDGWRPALNEKKRITGWLIHDQTGVVKHYTNVPGTEYVGRR